MILTIRWDVEFNIVKIIEKWKMKKKLNFILKNTLFFNHLHNPIKPLLFIK